MPEELKVKGKTIRLIQDDITALEIEAWVYYARPDLALGSGYGTAVAVRGGPQVAEELKKLGPLAVGEAVVTGAGTLKARHIVHAVGPRFQEQDLEGKLRQTIQSALQRADEKKISRLAFPAMGAGFYGVPLALCAKVCLETAKQYLEGATGLIEIVFCLRDSREYAPFAQQFKKMGGASVAPAAAPVRAAAAVAAAL